MVILDENTDATGSDATPDSSDGDPTGAVDRLVDIADRAATLIEPFATLLTAVVQAATVYTLVRKA